MVNTINMRSRSRYWRYEFNFFSFYCRFAKIEKDQEAHKLSHIHKPSQTMP